MHIQSKAHANPLILSMGLFILDSLITYFSGFTSGVNTLSFAFVMFSLIIYVQKNKLVISINMAIFLLFTIVFYFIGSLNRLSDNYFNLLNFFACITLFVVCYNLGASERLLRAAIKTMAIVGFLYCLVCGLASIGLLSATVNIGYIDGQELVRPYITTNANFQILYLLPAYSGVVFFKRLRLPYVVLVFVLITLTMSFVQTRSGAIFNAVFFLIVYNIFCYKKKIQLIFVTFASVSVLFLMTSELEHIFGSLIYRFTESSDNGLSSRLDSISSLLIVSSELSNWLIPIGFTDYIDKYRMLPHNSLTGSFLELGIYGVVLYALLFLKPVYIFFKSLLFSKISNDFEYILLLLLFATVSVSFTLPAMFFKLNWMLSGLYFGVEFRKMHL